MQVGRAAKSRESRVESRAAARVLKHASTLRPTLALVLGSGFGRVTEAQVIPYAKLPGFLAPKVALTNSRELAGMGMWALGYDRGQPGYWDVIANAYGAPKITALTITDASALPIVPASVVLPPTQAAPGYSRSNTVTVTVGLVDGPVA